MKQVQLNEDQEKKKKYVLKDSVIYIGLTDMKNVSNLNAYLNKTLQREIRKCFLKQ